MTNRNAVGSGSVSASAQQSQLAREAEAGAATEAEAGAATDAGAATEAETDARPGSATATTTAVAGGAANRLAWLDVLRGIAALCVVFDHLGYYVLQHVRHEIYTWFNFG